MITINKVKNLLCYFHLMCITVDSVGNLPDPTYVLEKYNLFFSKLPDTIYKFLCESDYNHKMEEDIINYTNKWNLDIDDFKKTDEYLIIAFTLALTAAKYSDYSISLVLRLVQRYNLFFSDYGCVTEKLLINTLHKNLHIYFYTAIENGRYDMRNIFLKQLTNKLNAQKCI